MSLFNTALLTQQDLEFVRKATPKKDSEVFQDEFELVYTVAKREYLTDTELLAIAPGSVFVFDTECFTNYWLAAFKHIDSGKYVTFEIKEKNTCITDRAKLHWMLETFLCVGFNSRTYDIPMVSLALEGFIPKRLKQASNAIILSQLMPYQIEQHYKIKLIETNTIDLIEVAPLQGSLKLYAARLHCKRIQDMPIEPDAILSSGEMETIKDYCFNDLDCTEELLKFLYPQLNLRYAMSNMYGIDLRSKSDAQIAEAVIVSELKKATGIKPERPKNYSSYFFYQVPSFVQFKNESLKATLQVIKDTLFTVGEKGEIPMPNSISGLKISLGNCVYRLGMGGLHSSEKTVSYKATAETKLIDRDVASYYPQIILNQGLYPKHLGKDFLKVYKLIVERRIAAKHSGDKVTADSLKITINGLFGKFGSKWSTVYAPDLLIQVTISGQLCLLMLIEMIESVSIPVISANTDGVVIACPVGLESTLGAVVSKWERITAFETEETRYIAVYSRDVNNYGAIKENGEIKVKGSYSEKGSGGNSVLSKNPETLICNDAAIEFVSKGIAVEETICACKDVRRFVVVRNVKGGAKKSEQYLGKTIRWYYSTKMKGDIRYCLSGNKVPMSDGARPMMELSIDNKLPNDIDYKRYIDIANEILVEIAAIAPKQSLQGSLFS